MGRRWSPDRKGTDTGLVHCVVCPFTPLLSPVLINRPRRDGTLSWRWYTVAASGIRTHNLAIASPAPYHMANGYHLCCTQTQWCWAVHTFSSMWLTVYVVRSLPITSSVLHNRFEWASRRCVDYCDALVFMCRCRTYFKTYFIHDVRQNCLLYISWLLVNYVGQQCILIRWKKYLWDAPL